MLSCRLCNRIVLRSFNLDLEGSCIATRMPPSPLSLFFRVSQIWNGRPNTKSYLKSSALFVLLGPVFGVHSILFGPSSTVLSFPNISGETKESFKNKFRSGRFGPGKADLLGFGRSRK